MSEALKYIEQSRKHLLIVVFIYISIFINSYVFFREPFEFYIGYLIFIALLPNFLIKYGVNQKLILIFIILLIVGVINVIIGNNTTGQFLKVYIGLLISYLFYYSVILELKFDISQLFKWYLKGAYIVSLLGLFQFICFQVGFGQGYRFFGIFNKWGLVPGGNFGLRINSVFPEPTHLGAALSAAFFVALHNLIRKESYGLSKIQSVAIVAVYFLSFSGLGQIGIFLAFIFLALNFGLVRYVIILVPLVIISFNYLYNNVYEFKTRFDSTFDLFVEDKKFELGVTQGSSFILYNNYIVAKENFKTNFLFGTGVGSHSTAFDRYSIAKDIKVYGFNLNSADANSMFLRLMSETGLFGLTIFFVIMIKGYVMRDPNNISYHWLVSNGILIMILLNLFRQGHYFLNGFPFFLLLYYFNGLSYKAHLSNQLDE